jgi:hypothetical protein
MGDNQTDVNNCAATPKSGKSKCALWKYRNGAFSKWSSTETAVRSAIHKHCKEYIGKEKDIESCTSDGSGGYHRCILYDYRNLAKAEKYQVSDDQNNSQISTKNLLMEGEKSSV